MFALKNLKKFFQLKFSNFGSFKSILFPMKKLFHRGKIREKVYIRYMH